MTSEPGVWEVYEERIRLFDRRALLELIAQASCAYLRDGEVRFTGQRHAAAQSPMQPFVLAAAARDAVMGAEGRASLDLAALEWLCGSYVSLDDPVSRPGSPYSDVSSYMVRMAYEQFNFQLSPHNECARSWALFAETAAFVGAATMTDEAWRATLGCTLEEYMRLAFALHVLAASNNGWVNLSVALPELCALLRSLSPSEVSALVRRNLAATIEEQRADPGNVAPPEKLEKYRYNPLVNRPYLVLEEMLLAPSPQIALHKIWPSGLYYSRVRDAGFTDELGEVFESYIGRQLKLLEQAGLAQVLPKVEFTRGRQRQESVDWFVVTPEVLVLVEVKATRLAAEARLGLDRLGTDVHRTLGKAYEQLARTAEMIRSGEPEFVHLPKDRPIVGLAVTLEPYWLFWERGSVLPPQPATVAAHPVSCADVEGWVSAALAGPVVDPLLALVGPPTAGSRTFAVAFASKPKAPNPILDAAFDRIFGQIVTP